MDADDLNAEGAEVRDARWGQFGMNNLKQQEDDDGELMMSLSPSSLANLWAMFGLILAVNIIFCVYRVCTSPSKYISESDHYASETMEFHD